MVVRACRGPRRCFSGCLEQAGNPGPSGSQPLPSQPAAAGLRAEDARGRASGEGCVPPGATCHCPGGPARPQIPGRRPSPSCPQRPRSCSEGMGTALDCVCDVCVMCVHTCASGLYIRCVHVRVHVLRLSACVCACMCMYARVYVYVCARVCISFCSSGHCSLPGS